MPRTILVGFGWSRVAIFTFVEIPTIGMDILIPLDKFFRWLVAFGQIASSTCRHQIGQFIGPASRPRPVMVNVHLCVGLVGLIQCNAAVKTYIVGTVPYKHPRVAMPRVSRFARNIAFDFAHQISKSGKPDPVPHWFFFLYVCEICSIW